VRKTFIQRWLVEDIEEIWYQDIKPFRQKVKAYLLYD